MNSAAFQRKLFAKKVIDRFNHSDYIDIMHTHKTQYQNTVIIACFCQAAAIMSAAFSGIG